MAKQSGNDALCGRWISNNVQSEWGEARIELIFSKSGHLVHTVRYNQEGTSLTTEGKYEWKNNLLTSEVFAKGNPVYARLDDDRLTIRVGEESAVEFFRKNPESRSEPHKPTNAR